MSPQCKQVIDYLTRHGSITPNEALLSLGIARLGARIWELKERHGFGIKTKLIDVPTRFGTTTKVARYSLGAEEQAA